MQSLPSTLSRVIIRCVDIMIRSAYGFTQMTTRTQWTEQKGILQCIFVVQNKRERKPKEQTRMYNPETLATLCTQDRGHTKTQNTKQISNTDSTTKPELTQMLTKSTKFLALIRHPPCYPYSQDVVDTTLRKQTKLHR